MREKEFHTWFYTIIILFLVSYNILFPFFYIYLPFYACIPLPVLFVIFVLSFEAVAFSIVTLALVEMVEALAVRVEALVLALRVEALALALRV